MRKIDPIEQYLFLEGVYMRYGFDFRQYAQASLTRRMDYVLGKFQIEDPLDLLRKVLKDKEFFNQVLSHLTTTTTEFFRDPTFFLSLREKVIPLLRTYPNFNIWVAGCSTGEEVYSLSILLKEEGLLNRATIFATDINPQALKTAREGIYRLDATQVFTKNYIDSGGTSNPSNYYTADYGLARFDASLRENVVFTEHNLVTDEVFGEMHLILCRNVLIYFSRELQDRVFQLFAKSLIHKGVLALGSKETIRFSKLEAGFEGVDTNNKIFQKIKNSIAYSTAKNYVGAQHE